MNLGDLLIRMVNFESDNKKQMSELQESYSGLSAEIRFLMEERDKGIERIKKLESLFPLALKGQFEIINMPALEDHLKNLESRINTLELATEKESFGVNNL